MFRHNFPLEGGGGGNDVCECFRQDGLRKAVEAFDSHKITTKTGLEVSELFFQAKVSMTFNCS